MSQPPHLPVAGYLAAPVAPPGPAAPARPYVREPGPGQAAPARAPGPPPDPDTRTRPPWETEPEPAPVVPAEPVVTRPPVLRTRASWWRRWWQQGGAHSRFHCDTIRWHGLLYRDVTGEGADAAALAGFLEDCRAEAAFHGVAPDALRPVVSTRRDGTIRHVWVPICHRHDCGTWWDQ